MNDPFKTCNTCKKTWASRADFLADPETSVVGYQGSPISPDHGFFYINHMRHGCGTTLALMVRDFADLYDGPLLEKHRTGSTPCPNHCFYTSNLSDRPEACECRYVRHVMQRIKSWPKKI